MYPSKNDCFRKNRLNKLEKWNVKICEQLIFLIFINRGPNRGSGSKYLFKPPNSVCLQVTAQCSSTPFTSLMNLIIGKIQRIREMCYIFIFSVFFYFFSATTTPNLFTFISDWLISFAYPTVILYKLVALTNISSVSLTETH